MKALHSLTNGLARTSRAGRGRRGVRARAAFWSAAVACGLGGCTLILQEDREQCSSAADCQALGQAFEGSLCVNNQCVLQGGPLPGGGAGAGGGGEQACQKTSDCKGSFAQDAICRQNQCVRLTNEKCTEIIGEVDDDTGLVVAMLVPQSDDAQERYGAGLVKAVEVARAAYQDKRPSGSLQAPAVVVCDESQGLDATLRRLINEVGAQVVLGPVLDQNLTTVLGETTSKGVIVVSPTIDDRALAAKANDDGVLWSCRRNREQVVGYYAAAVEHAARVFAARRPSLFNDGTGGTGGSGPPLTLRAAMLVPNDPATANFYDDALPTLKGADKLFSDATLKPVNYAWSPANPSDYRGIAAQVVGAFGAGERPNLILVPTAIDNVTAIIAEIEKAWPATGVERPSYFVDEHPDGISSLLDNPAQQATNLRGRLLGLRPRRTEDSNAAYEQFVRAYKGQVGQSLVPLTRTEYAYDCFFEITYALQLARDNGVVDASGGAFRESLRALSSPSPEAQKVLVGPDNAQSFLGASAVLRNFDLVGSTGSLQYTNLAKGYPEDDGEIYCVDRLSKAFCGVGVTFAPDGTKTDAGPRCQCEEPNPG
jgi:hypothetical protein